MQSHRIGQLGAVALLALPTQAFAQIATPAPPIPELLRVTRTDDNGERSLRWAIERNNAAPGRFRIEIDPAGQAPYVIKPASALPPIKGPVQIEGAAWKRTGDFIAVDGSGYIEYKGMQTCPGAVPGQYGANVRTTTNPGLGCGRRVTVPNEERMRATGLPPPVLGVHRIAPFSSRGKK